MMDADECVQPNRLLAFVEQDEPITESRHVIPIVSPAVIHLLYTPAFLSRVRIIHFGE